MFSFPNPLPNHYQGAVMYGASGLLLSSVTPHVEHAVSIVHFLLTVFDGMARFGGAVLIVAGWVKLYQTRQKKVLARKRKPRKVIVP